MTLATEQSKASEQDILDYLDQLEFEEALRNTLVMEILESNRVPLCTHGEEGEDNDYV